MVALYLPMLKSACHRVTHKSAELERLFTSLSEAMKEGRRLEKSGASLDEMCASFGNCLSVIFSFGTDGKRKQILSSVGSFIGRYIYTLDAMDDLEADEKKGAFNPILLRYGSAEKAKEHFEELDLVLSYYASQMKLALDLLDGDRNLFAICDNIISFGLSQSAGKIMKPKTENQE